MRGLLNVVQEYTWELHGGSKMTIYLNAIGLLSAMSQVSFTFSEDSLSYKATLTFVNTLFPQDYFIYHVEKGRNFLFGCD